MSKMNQLSLEQQDEAYEQYIEEQRQELRKEGMKELINELVRQGVIIDAGGGMYSYRVLDKHDASWMKFVDLKGYLY